MQTLNVLVNQKLARSISRRNFLIHLLLTLNFEGVSQATIPWEKLTSEDASQDYFQIECWLLLGNSALAIKILTQALTRRFYFRFTGNINREPNSSGNALKSNFKRLWKVFCFESGPVQLNLSSTNFLRTRLCWKINTCLRKLGKWGEPGGTCHWVKTLFYLNMTKSSTR